jgi:hypothetical protein
MAVMRMVQPTVHQIVHMAAVRHGFMTASRTMNMTAVVPESFGTDRCTIVWILGRDFDHMLINMALMWVVQVPVVEVIDVVAMPHSGMAAPRTVLVRMIRVLGVRTGHDGAPSLGPASSPA